MADILDEAFLKLISLTIRFVQLALSLTVMGGMIQGITDISNMNSSIPERFVAVASISAINAIWSGIALLLTCCAGKIMLEIETALDLTSVIICLAEPFLLRKDALTTTTAFVAKYSKHARQHADRSGLRNAQGLVRMSFIVSIVLM